MLKFLRGDLVRLEHGPPFEVGSEVLVNFRSLFCGALGLVTHYSPMYRVLVL